MSAAQKKKNQQPSPATTLAWTKWVSVLLTVAALGAAYLAYVSISNGPVAGCGEGSGCSKVLQSRWAYWLGIPVSVPAVFAYLGLMAAVATIRRRPAAEPPPWAWMTTIAISLTVAGAAVWFVGLQVFVIKAFCKFCMTTHTCGLAASILCLCHIPRAVQHGSAVGQKQNAKVGLPPGAAARFALAGWAGLGILVGGQFAVQPQRNVVKSMDLLSLTNAAPVLQAQQPAAPLSRANPPVSLNPRPPGTNRPSLTNRAALPARSTLTAMPPSLAALAAAPMGRSITNRAGVIAQRMGTNVLSLHAGAIQFPLDEVPVLGSLDAPHLIVSVFDYTCHHCRELHPLLVEAQKRFSNQLCVVSIPMPMATNCNPAITRYFAPHAKACDYAQLGLAVWRADRQVSPRFDDWLFAPEKPVPVEQARAYAAQLVGAEKLEKTLADEWNKRMIHSGGYLYHTNYLKLGNGMLPQLIVGQVVSFGPLNSVEDLLKLLREHEGLP